MRIALFITLLLFSLRSYSQNSTNQLILSTNTGLNYSCTDPTDLETDTRIASALTLTVKTAASNCSIYARIFYFSGPSGFTTTTYPLDIDWTSDTSPNAGNLVTARLSLTASDQRLFTQPRTSSTYAFNYDLWLDAPGYNYPVGHYNYIILFTMTQP